MMKWNAIDTKVKGIGRDIVFANGKYYLCHYNPNGIAISDNLKTWTNIEINTTHNFMVVVHYKGEVDVVTKDLHYEISD